MKGIEGMITFTYYNDIEKAAEFYRETLGFNEVMNKNWVKIYKLGQDSHIGLVDANMGHLKPAEEKPDWIVDRFCDDVKIWNILCSDRRNIIEKPLKNKKDCYYQKLPINSGCQKQR